MVNVTKEFFGDIHIVSAWATSQETPRQAVYGHVFLLLAYDVRRSTLY